jgi:hypothetical protein
VIKGRVGAGWLFAHQRLRGNARSALEEGADVEAGVLKYAFEEALIRESRRHGQAVG